MAMGYLDKSGTVEPLPEGASWDDYENLYGPIDPQTTTRPAPNKKRRKPKKKERKTSSRKG